MSKPPLQEALAFILLLSLSFRQKSYIPTRKTRAYIQVELTTKRTNIQEYYYALSAILRQQTY